jgi:hypothetical protein
MLKEFSLGLSEGDPQIILVITAKNIVRLPRHPAGPFYLEKEPL